MNQLPVATARRSYFLYVLGFLVSLTMSLPLRAQVIFLETFDNVGAPPNAVPGQYYFPAGWTRVNVDNLTPYQPDLFYMNDAWIRRDDFGFNGLDSAAFSTSFYSTTGTADDWMWTPAIALPATSTQLELSWNAVAYDSNFPDGYEVRILTTPPTGGPGNLGNMVSASTMVFSTAAENWEWTARKADLTAFAGQTVYIGFRNNSTHKYLLVIDDVQVAELATYLGELSGVGVNEYTQYPLHEAAPVTLSGGTITNIGVAPLTNVRMHVSVRNAQGTEVFGATATETATLAPGNQAAFSFATGWEPTEADAYTLNYFPSYSETGPFVPDTISYPLTITDSVYARDNGDAVGVYGIGGANGGYLGQAFQLTVPADVHGVMAAYGANSSGTVVGQRYAAAIWDTDGTGKPKDIVATTDTLFYTDNGALATTLPMHGGKKRLPAGTYVVTAIEFPGEKPLRLVRTSQHFTPHTVWAYWANQWGTVDNFAYSLRTSYYIRLQLTEADVKPPAVTAVAVPADGYHVENDVLEFTVQLDEPVLVDETGGSPQLEVTIGTETVMADYVSGSGSDELLFRYTVQAGDMDADGIEVGNNMVLDGATIRDAAGNDLALALHNIAPTDQVLVNAIYPTVTLSTGTVGPINHAFTVTAVFSEVVTDFMLSDFVVTNAVLSDLETADNITYTVLVSPVTDGTVSLEVLADAAVNVANNGNTASNSINVTYDGTAPAAPTGLVIEVGEGQLSLGWATNVEADLESYRVYGGAVGEAPVLLETVMAPQAVYTHTGLINGTEYGYRISAIDAVGNESALSVGVSGTPIASQTITFNGLVDAQYGDSPIMLTATASSGLAVAYTTSDAAIASVVNDQLTIHGVGTITITATQGGNAAYNAAVPVMQQLTITPLEVTVTADHKTKVFGQPDPALTYTGVPALVAGDTFTGVLVREPGDDAGSYAITQGTLALNSHYTLVFEEAELQITPASLQGILTLTGDRFVYDGEAKLLAIAGIIPAGVTVSYTGNNNTDAGVHTVTARIDGGTNYEDLTLTATLEILPAARTLDFPALADRVYGDTDFSPEASSSSGESISYTSSNTAVAEITPAGRIRIIGAGEVVITATLPENANYTNRPTVSRTLLVDKATQSIRLEAPATVNRDAGKVAITATSSSGLPVAITLDDEQVATWEGTALQIHRLGTVRVTAMQAGDNNHRAAEAVTVSVRVIDPVSDFPVRVHQAVSPNGDGINEFLMIEGIRDFRENRVKVFNRNGTVVWEASGYDNDRIAFRGVGTGQKQLQAGTYYYIVEVQEDGKNWQYRSGYFVLRY